MTRNLALDGNHERLSTLLSVRTRRRSLAAIIRMEGIENGISLLHALGCHLQTIGGLEISAAAPSLLDDAVVGAGAGAGAGGVGRGV